MRRIFPIKYWADRIKQTSSIEEIYEQAAYQLIGEDLAEKMKAATIEMKKNPPIHFKKKYPFNWSCIR